MSKTCTKCKEIKSLVEFRNDAKCKSGLSSWCKSCHNNATKCWHQKNRPKIRVNALAYYYRNKEKCILSVKKYRSENRSKYNSYHAIRNKKVMQAIPKWADKNSINKFYENCPKGMEVDHIVPVLGKTVCGLHVLENLQYLTKKENCSKSNKWGTYHIR